MAYVDLMSTGVTPVQVAAAGTTTYNFSYDTPIAADGSPNITHIGFQIDGQLEANYAGTSTLGRLINSMRIKIGSNTIIDFNDPAPAADAATPGNLSVLCQKVGGFDVLSPVQAGALKDILGEMTLPFGLDASKSHRVNVQITLNSEIDWSGDAAGKWSVANTEFNMVHYFGQSKDTTIYGSRQDFTLTNGAIRSITIYGKQNYEMLGISCINDTDTDGVTEVRVNNGAFRALKASQWRVLDSTYTRGIRSDAGVPAPTWVLQRLGFLFLDLKRITAGADIQMSVTSGENTTYSFFPIWVASIGQRTSRPPSQTISSQTSTAKNVEAESNY